MKILAVVAQKGGAGKTTLSVNLATAAHLLGIRALVLDLDPQASASAWGTSREQLLPEEDGPVVLPAQAGNLVATIDRARAADAEFVVIDTPPFASDISVTAAEAADLVLLPCRPAMFDLRTLNMSLRIASIAGTRAVALLSALPHFGDSLRRESEEIFEALGVKASPTAIGQRIAFQHAIASGRGIQEYEPKNKGAQEVEDLRAWLANEMGGDSNA